ncbi:hypothetical protein [Streptomyces cellulosae]|uniref:Secreted protein n=1 Tax=Streptomyces cellulosae TaxID=1968 RepID=A0ABW7YKH1_STRCE
MLGSAGALAAASMFTAPAAHADSSICNPGSEACAEFQSYGEVFTVHDYNSDGFSTVGLLDWEGHVGAEYECWNRNGAAGAAARCDYEFTEGLKITYQVCKWKASTGLTDCSGWVEDYA